MSPGNAVDHVVNKAGDAIGKASDVAGMLKLSKWLSILSMQ